MKTKLLIISLILMVSLLSAGVDDITLTVVGSQYYNVLRVSSFDTKNPQNQPTFFTLTVKNNKDEDIVQPYLHFQMIWNNQILIDSRCKYKDNINKNREIRVTNREIFDEAGRGQFHNPDPPIDPDKIINNIRDLGDAILNTGFFPDGRYEFHAWFEEENKEQLSNSGVLVFTVRNPGGIQLITPGVPVGGRIPTISGAPISFRWSSNLSLDKKPFRIVVNEFEDASMLTPGFIEISGNTILNREVTETYYSDFLELKEGKYYAWQIATELADPTVGGISSIKSQHHVFRYSSGGDDTNVQNVKDIELFLRSLNRADITTLLESGYSPSGIIESKGRVFREVEIQTALQELIDRNKVRIEIVD